MKKFIGFLMLAFFLFGFASSLRAEPQDLFDRVNLVKKELTVQFKNTDRDLEKAARELKNPALTAVAIRQILGKLARTNPAVIDCSLVSPEGILKKVEPKKYRGAEGLDISSQEQMKRLRETKKPVVSGFFFSVEKTRSLDFEYPMLENGKLLGSVSLMADPESYFGRHIRKMGLEKEKRYYWAVLQSDGTLLYDTDDSQIGKNPLTDPRYKKYSDLRRVIKNITQLKSGSDQYTEIEGHTQGTVQAYWDTVEIYGSKFKIVAMKLIGEKKV